MRNTYRIYPLPTCELEVDKGTFTYLLNYGQRIWFPVYAWLIKGEGRAILVDTGITAEDVQKYVPYLLSRDTEDTRPIEEGLRRVGMSVSDVDTIIFTHLEFDHFANADKFPDARLVVQEEELRFAEDPHPVYSKKYNKDWYAGLNFETVNGDTEIVPGIEVVFTPGHTAGTQSVSIDTERGKMVIAGFCCIDENFSEEGDIIPGRLFDALKAYDSMVRIRSIGGTIIPTHSARFQRMESIP